MSQAHYETGQVCLNGHPTTAYFRSSPERHSKFCGECGQSTITACPKCSAEIRGAYIVPNVISIGGGYDPPSFCHECGAAYPWTERKSAALAEAIDELDQLSQADREKLKQSIPDVIQDTPKTQTAASRFGKAIGSAGQWGGKLLTEVLTKVATEAALKMSGLKP